VVQQRLGDAGLLGDAGHGQLGVRVTREQPLAELDELGAALVDVKAAVGGLVAVSFVALGLLLLGAAFAWQKLRPVLATA
jgi:hypothetical protein